MAGPSSTTTEATSTSYSPFGSGAWTLSRIPVDSPVEMFASGNEAADHGQADIEDPTEDAVAVQERLLRKYERLRTE